MPLEELRERITSGQLKAADEVWRQGTPDWITARRVTELRDLFTRTSHGERDQPSESPPVRESTGPGGDDFAHLLPLVRRSTNGTVILRRDVLVLTSAPPTKLTEEAVLGTELVPGSSVRCYSLEADGPGPAIESLHVQRAAHLGPARRRLRFLIKTDRGTDECIVSAKHSGHLLRAFRTLLGDRFSEGSKCPLTLTECLLIVLAVLGALCLGLAWAGSYSPAVVAMVRTLAVSGAIVLVLTFLAFLFILLADLGTRSRPGDVPSSRRRRRPSREPFRSRSLGWIFKGAGVAYLGILFCSGVAAYLPRQAQWLVGSLAAMPGLFLLFTGYRLSQRVFTPGRHPDPRPPIVYLRSFADDDFTNFQPNRLLAELHGLNRPKQRRSTFGRLGSYLWKLHPVRVLRLFFNIGADTSEEVLARGFKRHGPFVAIGRPGEGLPTVGADRMYVRDDDWQRVVLDYLDRCKAVVLQPSKAGYILWEITQSFRRVSPHRVLLCMINFWQRPEDYDDFRVRLACDHGLQMPRLVPFRDQPCFVYFEPDGTARLQDLCYRSPIFWTFTGNAVNIRRTIKSFVAGLDGQPRPKPLPARRHPGHGILSLGVYAAFLWLVLFPGPLVFHAVNLALIVPNLSFSKTAYTGRAIDYRVTLSNAWHPGESPRSEPLEYLFHLGGNAGNLTVAAFRNKNEPYLRALRELPRDANGLPRGRISDRHPEFVEEIERSLGEGFEKAGFKVKKKAVLPAFLAAFDNHPREMVIDFDGESTHTVQGRLWHEFRFVCRIPAVGEQIVRHRIFADLDDVVTLTTSVPDMDFYNRLALEALDSVAIVTSTRDRLIQALSAAPSKTFTGKKVPYRLRLPDVWTEKPIQLPPGFKVPSDMGVEEAMFDLEGKLAMIGTSSTDEDIDVTEPAVGELLAETRRGIMRTIFDQMDRRFGGNLLARIEPLGIRQITVGGRTWLEIRHRIGTAPHSYVDLYRICSAGGGLVAFEANLYVADRTVEDVVEAAFRSLEVPPEKPKPPQTLVAYQGKRLGYEFRLGSKDWEAEALPQPAGAVEYVFAYRGGVGKLAVDVLDEELGDDEKAAQTVRSMIETGVRQRVPQARVTLQGSKVVTVDDVRWLALKFDQDYGQDLHETKHCRVYQSLRQTLLVSVVLPTSQRYDELAEKALSTLRIRETPEDRLLRLAGDGKPIEYRGKGMNYTVSLPPLWKEMEIDQKEVQEATRGAERGGVSIGVPERMFALRGDKLAQLGVEIEPEEWDVDQLEEIAKAQLEIQRRLLRGVFGGLEFEVRLVGSRKVWASGREWAEFEMRVQLVKARRGFQMISRFTPYKGRTLSISANLYHDHPAVRKLAVEALDAVRIIPPPPPAAVEASWTGSTVVLTGFDVHFRQPAEKGKPIPGGTLGSLSYKVLADKDGQLHVREGGQEVWFDKDDAVRLDKAVDYFTERLRHNTKDVAACYGRAEAWNLRGKLDKAIEDFSEAIHLNPEDAAAFRNRALMWRRLRQYDKAIKDYDEAIRLEPKDASGYQGRGYCRYTREQYDKAIEDYTAVVRLGAASPETFTNRGNCLFARGEFDKALEDYSESIRLGPPEAFRYLNRALAWHRKREYAKAIADYSEAIRLNPKYTFAFDNRARAWIGKGDYTKALADFSEAIRLDPTDADTVYQRGNAWKVQKDYAKALQDYAEASRLAPKDHAYLEARAWLLAVCPVDKLRDGKKAVELARSACELGDWKQPFALAILAAAYAETGDFASAVKWQEKALDDKSYASREGDKARQRLQLYKDKKPYREE
jgi:tetratricopeptide (TPR) repeat protein